MLDKTLAALHEFISVFVPSFPTRIVRGLNDHVHGRTSRCRSPRTVTVYFQAGWPHAARLSNSRGTRLEWHNKRDAVCNPSPESIFERLAISQADDTLSQFADKCCFSFKKRSVFYLNRSVLWVEKIQAFWKNSTHCLWRFYWISLGFFGFLEVFFK